RRRGRPRVRLPARKSGPDRRKRNGRGENTRAASETRLLKLDASINKGNSGGPVVRISTGKVIGLASLKEGSLQERLQKLMREKPTASISIGGNDPIELIKFIVQDMETNLQLGLGYAVASEH